MPRRSLRALFPTVAIVAGVLLFGIGFVAWIESRIRIPARPNSCTDNLQAIGMALLTYQVTHGCFPPAYIAGGDGEPVHSWRVLLLPYFEDPNLHELYRQYDFSEPWNSSHNRTLASRIPTIYRCPSSNAAPGETCYVAIVGSKTGWPGTRSRDGMEFLDGCDNTIAVTEIADSGISWLDPRDLTFSQATQGINPPLSKPSISSPHGDGANCLFFSGNVQFILDGIAPELLRALLTADSGEIAHRPSGY